MLSANFLKLSGYHISRKNSVNSPKADKLRLTAEKIRSPNYIADEGIIIIKAKERKERYR